MASRPLSAHRRLSRSVLTRRAARFDRFRVRLPDGEGTTVHVAAYGREAFSPRVVVLEEPSPLIRWCREQGVDHAVVGGFFQRPDYLPLGELRMGGQPGEFVPFLEPWGASRGCLHVSGRKVAIAPRSELDPAPYGDLLQAGPLLVRGGRSVLAAADPEDSPAGADPEGSPAGADPEGFSAGAVQFDSDITDGRYPRAAIGLTDDRLLAVAVDGRNRWDVGMTLPELAELLVALGADAALNLDGGGSASLVHDGRLRNRPREQHGLDLLEGRAVVSAIVFEPRG